MCTFAVAGSKFDGTGFENEQIGHIHVALVVEEEDTRLGPDRRGLPCRIGGVKDSPSRPEPVPATGEPRVFRESLFEALG